MNTVYWMHMRPEPSPLDSFLRFVLGFLVFIGVSFGVTYGVSVYTMEQDGKTQQAAALRALLESAEGQ